MMRFRVEGQSDEVEGKSVDVEGEDDKNQGDSDEDEIMADVLATSLGITPRQGKGSGFVTGSWPTTDDYLD